MAEAKGTFTTWANRMSSGSYKKATEEEVDQAKAMLGTYRSLGKKQQEQFVTKFMETKQSKSFQWVKEYEESASSTNTGARKYSAKYRTRCFPSHTPLV